MTNKLTLPIEIGRRYVRRDGKVVTAQPVASFGARFAFVDKYLTDVGDPLKIVWRKTGRISEMQTPHPLDLVADAPEELTTYTIADYADILRAIADGKDIERRGHDGWVHEAKRDVLDLVSRQAISPTDFRIKPCTININGHEVPEPVRTQLPLGTKIWSFALGHAQCVEPSTWKDSEVMDRRLRNGLIHLTEEAARKHAEALLSFTRREG
jgi:hypothetical protein